MALLWLDSFDNYGTATGNAPTPTGIMARKYSATANESRFRVRDPESYGKSLGGDQTFLSIKVTPAITTNAIMIAGLAVRPFDMADPQNGYSEDILGFNEGTNRSLTLKLQGNGIAVTRGTGNYLGFVTNCFHFNEQEWAFIEMKAYCHDTNGWFVVRVNTVPVLTVNNVDTKNSTLGYYDRTRFSTSNDTRIGDFYVCDATGNINNDFLGRVTIHTIRPNGDVTNNFSSGNYSSIDEEICDDNTSYAVDNGSGSTLECDYEATQNFNSIVGVQINADLSVNTSTNIKLTANSGGNVTKTANINHNSSNINAYTTKTAVIETEPVTGNAWTPATINSASFGLEVQ